MSYTQESIIEQVESEREAELEVQWIAWMKALSPEARRAITNPSRDLELRLHDGVVKQGMSFADCLAEVRLVQGVELVPEKLAA